MDQRIFIARLNIEHYRERLHGHLDGGLRRLIERLLAEEEAKLSSLRGEIAEGLLSQLLDFLGSWTSAVADEADRRASHLRTAELAIIFDKMPCAMALFDGVGKIVLANEAARLRIGDEIPSRDPQHFRRWRLLEPSAQALDPLHWPGERALRGEPVNPGVVAIHRGNDGRETELRIAAVPVKRRDGSVWGAIGAAYDLSVLEHQDIHDLLERLLADEQARSLRRGREGSHS